jgi:hypothetical protein
MRDSTTPTFRKLWFVPLLVGCSSHMGAVPEGASCSGLGHYNSTLIAQLQAASLIFHGTVTAVHAKTVPDPIDTTDTVIAHVDTTAFASPDIQELGTVWGDMLTLQLLHADLAVGDSALFATTLVEFNGGALEVGEITRAHDAQLETDVPKLMALFAADPLYARIASSVAIIAGDVASTAPSGAMCDSEHCPAWAIAQLAGTDALCGDPAAAAGFVTSGDIAWRDAPKLASGQQGVLLLHHAEVPVPFSTDTPDRFVIDALDVHPLADQAEIAGLLASPPSF